MNTRTVTVSAADVSLYHVAAREMGDARHWWALAEANGMSDPLLDGIVELRVPADAPRHLDGVPRR